jgi:hypothetical protein
MNKTWKFEYISCKDDFEGNSVTYIVECGDIHDIWVYRNGSIIPWNSLYESDKDAIVERVEAHFFMEEASVPRGER